MVSAALVCASSPALPILAICRAIWAREASSFSRATLLNNLPHKSRIWNSNRSFVCVHYSWKSSGQKKSQTFKGKQSTCFSGAQEKFIIHRSWQGMDETVNRTEQTVSALTRLLGEGQNAELTLRLLAAQCL